jgi:hypothetical protein
MHKIRTPWPVATRVQYIVAFEECRRRWLGLSGRRFCGSEFGRDLTALMRCLGIRHTRIRPRIPHLNRKVERVQRTAREEFWDGIGPAPLEE